ncbi:MAG TPA: winged helix-turn-helix domain-containing protein, partial [Polyangia bacterium]|nr:winged helix-turn-helix domain-containing protein [Polyangia bacterium]
MTFLEAALNILSREKRPLHFKELTERAMTKKLLTFVGRTPEVTMQTQLTAAVKKAPGNPFVRVKPGVFGLLRYPELPPEEPETAPEKAERAERPARAEAGEEGSAGRRRRRRR